MVRSKRLYSGDRRSECKIGVSIETSCGMEGPIVIHQEKDTFGFVTWILQYFCVLWVTFGLESENHSCGAGWWLWKVRTIVVVLGGD